MGELASKHISGTKTGSKEYIRTTELFFDKVFGDKKKFSHDFATKKGVFTASGIESTYEDGKTKIFKSLSEKTTYTKNAPLTKEVFLTGSFKGKKEKEKVRHTHVTKTIEFGGQPVGSKKESKGTIFEREFTHRLKECINGEVCKGKYHAAAGWLIGQLEKGGKKPIEDVKQLGGQNASRPFEVAGKQPFIAPRKHQDHGSVLTDMDVFHKDGTKTHLSAKLGPSLTFINPGSKTLFSDQDVKDHDISKDKGIALLKMCGLDEDAFCNVFNNFGKPAQKKKNLKHSGVKKVNTSILQNFVKTAMGSNYWMIHAKGNTQDEVNMYYMDPSDVNDKYSKITGDVEVFYGGRDGSGKRIDIAFANNHFSFNLNIRSKAGGTTYPTNIMLDYKTLSVTNKVTL